MLKIKLAGIYMIKNKISNYYYIGMSVDIFSRWSNHFVHLKLGRHSQKMIDDLHDFGVENFEFIILESISITEYKRVSGLRGKPLKDSFRNILLKKEREWMRKYSINFAYNRDNKYFS